MTVSVHPISATGRETDYVVQHMRVEDREELWALGRTGAYDAVERSVGLSTEAYVATKDGTPIAVLGAYTPVLGALGVPWLLGTREIDHCVADYYRLARRFTQHLLTRCDVLQNMASADNRKTLVFLSRVGFDIGEPFKVATGATAVLFTMGGTRNV